MAKNLGIEWYDPIFESADTQQRSKIIISGETEAFAKISIDNSKVIVIRGRQKQNKVNSDIVSVTAGANGVFELPNKLPQGLLQIPIQIKGSEKQNILILLEVGNDFVKMNAKTKKRPKKVEPLLATAQAPATPQQKQPKIKEKESSNYLLQLGIGGNFQKLSQKQEGITDLSFQNMQFPSLSALLRYSSAKTDLDLSFSSNPTSVSQAPSNFTLTSSKANWSVIGISFWWKTQSSKYLLGLQSHKLPFLSINSSNEVSLNANTMSSIVLGYGFAFGDPKATQFDFSASYAYPIAYESSNLKSFALIPKMGLEIDLFVRRPFGEKLIWGVDWKTSFQNHGYTYKDTITPTTIYNGDFSLMVSAFFLTLGYDF